MEPTSPRCRHIGWSRLALLWCRRAAAFSRASQSGKTSIWAPTAAGASCLSRRMSVTMNKLEALKNGSLGLAALAMVAALVFLYDKTQAVDLRERNEILGFLRELKEIDGRWDIDVLRARLEAGTNELPVINRTPAAVKALQQLNSALQNTPSATLSAWLPELSKTILQKAGLVEKFK